LFFNFFDLISSSEKRVIFASITTQYLVDGAVRSRRTSDFEDH